MKVNFINFSDQKDHRYFLLIGGEFILKQDAIKKILQKLANDGFTEKVSISQDELDSIQEIVSKNLGGSLFQANLILHIKHTAGKFPEKIKSLLEDQKIFKSSNIALIIESSIVTFAPFLTKKVARLEPIKPHPPVIKMFLLFKSLFILTKL